MKPEFIIIHHSLTEDGYSVNWQAIRDYHKKVNGWTDVGYHYGVENVNGKYEILKGRMDDEIGAHTLGFNDKSIGICAVGNFDSHPPSEDLLDVLTRLCKWLQRAHNIPTERVLGHWETYALRKVPMEKTCPGLRFSMVEFRSRCEI